MTTTFSLRRRSLLVLLALLVPLLALAVACGGGASADGPAPSRPAPAVAEPAPPPTPPIATAEGAPTLVARPGGDTDVFATPEADGPAQTLPARSEFGSALALVVVDDTTPGWLEVQLPTRPNESTGWIRTAGVELREVALVVHVDLAARRLTVTDGGDVVLETEAAIGAGATPTPVGAFFVTDKLVTEDPTGPYGPYALGLSAHSEVLTDFAGGDGQVGIHGTDDPSSIGEDVSNGCVRVPNQVIEQLSAMLPLGTPVVVS
jgi:lipoprotein-anchoring transpeptidase ErfK/SrfK